MKNKQKIYGKIKRKDGGYKKEGVMGMFRNIYEASYRANAKMTQMALDMTVKNTEVPKEGLPSIKIPSRRPAMDRMPVAPQNIRSEAVEWAGYTIAREMVRQSHAELAPIKPEEITANETVAARISEFRDQVKEEARHGYVDIQNFSDKDRVGFIGYSNEKAATQWAGLAVARDELAREGYKLPSLSVESAATHPIVREQLDSVVKKNIDRIDHQNENSIPTGRGDTGR